MTALRKTIFIAAVATGLIAGASACSVIDDSVQGITATGTAIPAPPAGSSDADGGGVDIIVTATVTSDAAETGEISVTVDAPRDSRSFAATWIECRILVDGEEVASHHAEGAASTAIRERRLQFGPS